MGSWTLRLHVAVVAFAVGTAASLVYDSTLRPHVVWGRSRPTAAARYRVESASAPAPVCVVGREAVEAALKERARATCIYADGDPQTSLALKARPAYPAEAARAGVSGEVEVEVVYDEWGRVLAANAVRGHPLLRGEAAEAACHSRFTQTPGGLAVVGKATLTYHFVLQ